jgi:prolyl oligopeptidase
MHFVSRYCLVLIVLAGCAAANRVAYPGAKRSAQVDVYHGVRVADPYRDLEDLAAPATQAWVQQENALSQPYLASIPARGRIVTRLTELWRYERIGLPKQRGKLTFYLRNDGEQNQDVLYVEESGRSRVLFDPNAIRGDATVAITDYEPSPDGRFVAYSISDGGTDWKIWRVRDAETGQDLSDELRYIKFTQVSWARDGGGFYYSRYAVAADGRGDDNQQVSLVFHRLNTPQSDDRFVHRIGDHPTRNPYGFVTDDGRYLVINIFDGYDRNGIDILDLRAADAKVHHLIDRWDALYDYIGSEGEEIFFHTTLGTPQGRIVAVNATHPDMGSWREVVAQAPESLNTASYVSGKLILQYLKDAKSLVKVYDAQGRQLHEVVLPGLGSADGFASQRGSADTFYTYTDFLTPSTVFRYDPAANVSTTFNQSVNSFDAKPYLAEQVFYKSKDGTRVPMFLVHRRDLKHDGRNPTLLYGYGGFAQPMTPAFATSVAMWLEMGGVYAVANIRGGNEYGEAWHEAGTKLHKQNVFDDFIAAAEWLIDQHVTARDRLVIRGRSNGGLLIGAAMTQRPDLFAATLPGVGVLDLLRYQTASANARQWSSDYGLSEDAAQFQALYAYSPVHHIKSGVCYPPTLITTADHDDRVVPWHSFKFGAALQAAQGCANPILVRVETRAGHGAGKPLWMQIEDIADQWAFAAQRLRMEW